MRPVRLALVALVAFTLAPVARAEWPHTANPAYPLSTAGGDQRPQDACGDGSGGVYIAWRDFSADGAGDVRLLRIDATGDPAAGWPAGGMAVCALAGLADVIRVEPGPAGSCYVMWLDQRTGLANRDVYVSRVLADGTLAPGWPANGRSISRTDKDERRPILLGDGVDGVYVVWELIFDVGGTDIDVYARRLASDGTFPSGFASPVGIATNTTADAYPAACPGSLSAWVVWQDVHTGGFQQLWGQRLLYGGGLAFSGGRALISGAPQDELRPAVASDGNGSVFVATLEPGLGAWVVEMRKFDPSGTLEWQFPIQAGITDASLPLALDFADVQLVSDDAGGVYVGWLAYDGVQFNVRVDRVDASGLAMWSPGSGLFAFGSGEWSVGVDASTEQHSFTMASDGAGGVVVAVGTTPLGFNNYLDMRVQRFHPGGGRMFGSAGVAVGLAPGAQYQPVLTADGRGGFVAAWTDLRTDLDLDAYAARFDLWGYLGDAAPRIGTALDVPADQGGAVELRWFASHLDAMPDRVVRQYSLWRALPGVPAAGVRRLGASEARPEGETRVARPLTVDGVTAWWEYIGVRPATVLPQYAAVVPTTTDSMPGSNPLTQFLVQAEGYYGDPFWASTPVSAYSADDLAPAMPQPFTGTYSAGGTSLAWGANGESDLAGYRLYRGTSASFVPSPANRIATPTTTTHVDAAGEPFYYRVSAVDIHGNEGPTALVLPSGSASAEGAPMPTVVALRGAAPNPSRGVTTLRWALPRAGRATLALFDASGRRVRVLHEGEAAAGEHTAVWDGRDDAGRALATGLYFARLDALEVTRVTRLARVE